MEFKSLDSVPMNIEPDKLDVGNDVMETLKHHKAKHHKSYELMFSNEQLKRAKQN